MTLYTQVASNRSKTWFFVLVYTLLILALGYFLSLWFGSNVLFIFAAVICIVQGFVAYWWADSIALATAHAQPLPKEQFGNVYKIVENLSITAGLPMPRLYYIPDPALNAFATGRDAKHAAIAITAGAIEKLNDNELAGVLAHELSHVGDEDIRLMSMVMVMAGLISLLANFFMRSLWFGGDRRRDDSNGDSNGLLLIVGIILSLLAPIAATLIQLAISRKREFMADANGVLLTRYPEGLISALRKIGGDETPVAEANTATAPMYIDNPLKNTGQWMAKLFSTHPPIEERIKALEKGSGLQS